MSEAQIYFKELQQDSLFFKWANHSKWEYLLSKGFSYSEITKIMSKRRFFTDKHQEIINRVDSNKYWTRKRFCKRFNISSSRLSMILNGDSTSKTILKEVEQILNKYDKNKK